MNILDRITQLLDKQERQDTLYVAVRALPDDERLALLARLFKAEDAGVEPVATPGPATPSPVTAGTSYVDRAEAFVRQHPEGVRTREVAEGIGQDTSNVDGTLRQVLKRGTIERRADKWCPVTAPRPPYQAQQPSPGTPKRTLRDMITEVLNTEQVPLGATAIYQGVASLKPTVNRPSVDGEINRMKKDKLLVGAGRGARGGLYALATQGGEQEPNT